jgi:hypothetical protein
MGSGTDAIEVMLRALDIGPGSRVVVPAFAPSGVASGVLRSGAEIVFADIEEDGVIGSGTIGALRSYYEFRKNPTADVVLLRALEARGLLESLNGRIAVGWLVVVKILIILFLLPRAFRWIARNRPRNFDPQSVAALLPAGDHPTHRA